VVEVHIGGAAARRWCGGAVVRRRGTAAAARWEARTALGARSSASGGVVGEVVRRRHGRLRGRVDRTKLFSRYGGAVAAAPRAVGGGGGS